MHSSTAQPSLFGWTPNTPTAVKGWTLTKVDANTASAERGDERHMIRAYADMFSGGVTWDIPAELPEPVRAAAVKLLSPEVSVQTEPEPAPAKRRTWATLCMKCWKSYDLREDPLGSMDCQDCPHCGNHKCGALQVCHPDKFPCALKLASK